jgi:nucleoside-diphosphate-sugar epimerase
MRVLITGAGGFFGKALVRAFAHGGEEVLAADVVPEADYQPRPLASGGPVRYLTVDVADPASFSAERVGPVDGIVHAAALTPTMDEMKAEPARLVSVNLVGTLNALELARELGCRRFLFISSAGVYDQFTDTVLTEEDADGGFSLYGSAKLAAEVMLWRYGQMYGMDVGAVRPTSMYGPAEEMRDTRPFVTQVKLLVEAALAGRSVRVQGADAHCDWVYVDDVAEAAHGFFASGMGGRVFNLTSGQPVPFGEVVKAAQAVASLRVDDAGDELVDGSPDRPTVISNARARAELGFDPRGLKEGLERYLQEVRQDPGAPR